MRKLISALLFGALLLPEYALTLGMGEIEVNSALNQQLDARIELVSSVPEDAETLIIKLASREEFARAGLDRPFNLSGLRFKSMVENGKVYINVTTSKPVREPFLNFLVEVDWPKGHLLREYTILLDPPVFMGQQQTNVPSRPDSRPASSQGSTLAPVPSPTQRSGSGFRPSGGGSAPVAAPMQTAPVSSQSQTYAPAPVQQTSYSSPSGGYRIKAGDTAWSLADSMRPDQSVSVEQMMLAMLRINPEVFINENVNGLKKGYILRIPDRSEITSVSKAEAKSIVGEQNALWREYQQALGVDQPASAIDRESGSEYGSGIGSSKDSRLSIVSAGSGAAASGDTKDPTEMTAVELRQQLALAREQLETARVENEGLSVDVTSLEQKVEKMQSLLQIEDDAMAEIQAVAEGEESAAIDEEMAEMEAALSEETPGEAAVLDALDELTGEAGDEGAIDEEAAIDEEGAIDEEAAIEQEVAETEEVFMDELEGLEQLPAEEAPVDVMEPDVDVMPTEPQGLVASLLGNPLVAGGAALFALILLAVGYILVKRRRDNAVDDVEATLAADLEQGMGSDLEDFADSIEDESLDDFITGEEGEASVTEAVADAEDEFDAESTMVLPSAQDTVVTQAEAGSDDDEERDDVIAEADVYLAYGIYQQAEELLQSAIKENPDKDAYRVKLAETYFAGKDSDGMVTLGKEMKARLSGAETPAWQKIAALGKELCPDEDIFQQAGAVADLDIDDLMTKSPEPMDFDLGDETGEVDMPDLDESLSESMDETSVIPDMDETAVIAPVAEAADELEFDIGETDAVEEPAKQPEIGAEDEEEFSLDIEASELDIETEEAPSEEISFDMDLGEELEEADETIDADISLDDLDFTAEAEESLAEAVEAEPEIEAVAVVDDSDELNLSDLGDVDEVNTKLDLAKAYLDMGDHDGARDILDEVVAGGNDQQKKEAEELLGQID